MNAVRSARAGRYHHGDLPAALIAAVRQLIEAEGAEKLSLRAVAAAVGVSQTAPYFHFTDKAALVAAVAAEGFAEFQELLRARGAGEADPVKRLRLLAVGYVEFAVGAPELFRLMYGPTLDHTAHPELARAGAAGAGLLTEAVKACMPGATSERVRSAAAAAWSMVHGLAILCNDGRIAVRGPRDLERRVMAVTAHLDVHGLEAT